MDDRTDDATATATAPEEGLTFSCLAPSGAETPVVVEVPHAGLMIPAAVQDEVRISARTRLRDSDAYVDKLYARAGEAGAHLLIAHVSRHVVDLNRAPDDVHRLTVPDHPRPRGVRRRGVVWSTPGDRPLSYAALRSRLADYHTPYHAALADLIAQKKARFGYAIVLAAHSMPSQGAGKGERADVVPGTRGGSTADERLIRCVGQHFLAAGFSVKHDDPYRGGWTTTHYGKPRQGCHVVQIELNRALYLDEATLRPRERGFNALVGTLTELVRKMGTLPL